MSVEVPSSQVHAAAERLDADQRTGQVSLDTRAHATGDPLISWQWHLTATGAISSWPVARGAGAIVATIDTGADYAHPDLAPHLLAGHDFVDDDAVANDGNGHGTHVAGTIAAVEGNDLGVAGAAPDARVLPVRVLDNLGTGWMSDVAAGIVWATDNGARVINLSLTGPDPSPLVEDALAYARAHDVIVVCAAGNDGAASIGWPARYDDCQAVGALTQAGARAGFSNTGSELDLVAPGTDIVSTTLGGGYGAMDGTSMATPQVAAVAAQLIGMGLGDDQVISTMRSTATDLGPAGLDPSFGFGRIDALQAVQSATAQLALIPRISSYSAPAAGQLHVTGQALTGWRTLTVRTSGGTLRIYSSRTNTAGISVVSDGSQITVTGLQAATGRRILSVATEQAQLELGSVYMPLMPLAVTFPSLGTIRITGVNLDAVQQLQVRDSLGNVRTYANVRTALRSDAPVSLWSATTVQVNDPWLAGRQLVSVRALTDGQTLLDQSL
jgi:hypothetical protein